MRNSFIGKIVGCLFMVILLVSVAVAQPPAGGPGGGAPGAGGGRGQGGPGGGAPATGEVAIANPTYVSVHMEANVNKPAAEGWKRVGKFCDIGEWLQVACMITYGKDGELGAVRSIGREVLVGQTEFSYTYTQPVTAGRPYILYHGTLEIRPVTATTSKIIYTLVWDNSTMADDAAKDRDKTQRTTQFQRAVDNMKILIEGGTLPPAAPRGGGGGAGGGGGRGGAGGGAPGAGAPPRGQ